jgi:galactose mutarotase-like enzyme
VRHRGTSYPMTIHGFAPDAEFAVESHAENSCVLACTANDRTRDSYPFDFRLQVSFELSDATLVQTATVTNLGDEDMPSSVGFHPGFRWPLPSSDHSGRERHVVSFERQEDRPIRRISDRGLEPPVYPTPVAHQEIRLVDELFLNGAIVFDSLKSGKLWFGVPGSVGILVDLCDMPHLGIWTLPPANFLCIEPWQGYGDPEDFNGEFLDKPGIVRLSPGASYARTIRISFAQEAPDWIAS